MEVGNQIYMGSEETSDVGSACKNRLTNLFGELTQSSGQEGPTRVNPKRTQQVPPTEGHTSGKRRSLLGFGVMGRDLGEAREACASGKKFTEVPKKFSNQDKWYHNAIFKKIKLVHYGANKAGSWEVL